MLSRSKTVVFVDIAYKNRHYTEVVDFYCFANRFFSYCDKVDCFVYSKEKIEVYGKAELITDIESIKNYDEVVLYGWDINNFDTLRKNNKKISLRVMESIKGRERHKYVTTFYSTRSVEIYKILFSFRVNENFENKNKHVPLMFDFGFITKEVSYKKDKKLIIINSHYSKINVTNKIFKVLMNTKKVLKPKFELLILGKVSENQRGLLDKTDFYYKVKKGNLGVLKLLTLLSKALILIDMDNTELNVLQLLCYRYSVSYFGNIVPNYCLITKIEDFKESLLIKYLNFNYFRESNNKKQINILNII